MPKFKIYANSVSRYYIELIAKNKQEAYEKAEEADEEDFKSIIGLYGVNGDWKVEDNTIEKSKTKKLLGRRKKKKISEEYCEHCEEVFETNYIRTQCPNCKEIVTSCDSCADSCINCRICLRGNKFKEKE